MTSARDIDRRFPGVLDGVGIMAGAANVIMQLARRGVGRGVVESTVDSGKLFKHPIKRTRTTLTYLGVALLGTEAEKAAYREAVNGAHRQVRSTEKSPIRYNAFDPELQLWVAACLYWGVADSRHKLRGELPPATAEAMYQWLAPLGTTLQVKQEMWPADLAAFDAYWRENLAKIELDDEVRSYLLAFLGLKFMWRPLRWVFGPFHRFVTIGFLPEELREELGVAWSERQERWFARIIRAIGTVNRFMPRFVRHLPTTIVMWDFRWRLRTQRPLI